MEKLLLSWVYVLLWVQVWCHVKAQIRFGDSSGYACSDGPALCHAFVVYKAQAPHYMTLESISDLFGVSKSVIARASNLADEGNHLFHGQLLLVPITCGCMGNVSQANVIHHIRGDYAFSSLSSSKFQNLVDYDATVVANPKLDPHNLLDGAEVVMPIRCKCPSKSQHEKGIKMLITYVLDNDDTLDKISRIFNAHFEELVSESESMALSNSSTIFFPVSRRPILSQPVGHVKPTPTNSREANSHDSLLLGLYIAIVGIMGLRLVSMIRYKFAAFAKVSRGKFSPYQKLKSEDIEMGVQPEPLDSGMWGSLDKLIVYSPQVVKEATQNFSPMYLIKGSVYRGTIDGRDVAIKRMKGDVSEELSSLQKVEHENLVELEGFCVGSKGESYLIYEYVDNKSLDLWLHSNNNHRTSSLRNMGYSGLTWRTTLQIALDVATGLMYIHEHQKPSIVHRDLKSSNVLLNTKLRAKIANLGITRSGMNVATKHIKKGSEGYMAPEHSVNRLMSPKTDVFAFGVILLELISGKEAIVKDETGEVKLLWREMKTLECEDREEKLRKLIDPKLHDTFHIDSATSVTVLAKACLEEDATERPTMGEIVSQLSDLLDVCFEHVEC